MADWVEEQIVKHEWTGNVDYISYGQILVRCLDCKYFQWGDPDDETIFCGLHGRCYRWDFFCADGERKETDGH